MGISKHSTYIRNKNNSNAHRLSNSPILYSQKVPLLGAPMICEIRESEYAAVAVISRAHSKHALFSGFEAPLTMLNSENSVNN